jgi:hypothetical protein
MEKEKMNNTNNNVSSISGDSITVPRSELLDLFRALIIDTSMLTTQNGQYHLDQEQAADAFTRIKLGGFNYSDTYASDDAVVDAAFRAWVQRVSAQTRAA